MKENKINEECINRNKDINLNIYQHLMKSFDEMNIVDKIIEDLNIFKLPNTKRIFNSDDIDINFHFVNLENKNSYLIEKM